MAHCYTPNIQRSEDCKFKPNLNSFLSDVNKMSCMEIILPQPKSMLCSASRSLTRLVHRLTWNSTAISCTISMNI